MDKQTLSHYGWIVVMVLILSVMLAFATPFGEYIGRGASNVAMAMGIANNDAVEEENIAQLEDEWEQYLKKHYYGDLDKDGDVDDDDTTIMAEHIGKISQQTDVDTLRRMDLNGDAKINIDDLTLISRYVGGIINKFPVEDIPYYYGDINADGKIDDKDKNMLNDHLLNKTLLTTEQMRRADVNADNVVTTSDKSMLNAYLLDKIAFFTAGR
jgi:hypothetical protein